MKALNTAGTILFLAAFCVGAIFLAPIGIFLECWGVDCNDVANEMSVKE